ncbi:ABC-2 type transporter [Beutenbergia cavernae DSM 12333]|uniref:Transport permease protein n=1 Tax=Beutenbergia cavernae (strain ATCC BAA-8 / DSM 12333 / CCUG 43141 / JCM 11478 / NBRC 16432 / NCIMB 13614 / HKI 0122) TaxID=471853 RepID=C5BY42_BEUC1|nr:ABC transporter permease [Beutenbergia cavernae]ACQ78936.1 ABC-2 type transporter [Beutenbergia cavernae DSM 12333]
MTALAARPPADLAPATSGVARLREWWRDAATMSGRALRLVTRDPDSLVLGVVLPIMLMVLFVYVFGGAFAVGTEYLNYVTPGIILLCAGYGAANTAIGVARDATTGVIDRFRSMPPATSTVLVGHVVASAAKNLATTAVVFGVAFIMGFRPGASLLEWLGAVGVILLFVLAITWVAVFVGVSVRSEEAASGFTFFMLFLPYVSSAFVPPETMPAWLRGFAEHQPVTPVIETIRGLLVGTPMGNAPLLAVVWWVGIGAAFAVAAGIVFRNKGR